MKRYLTLFLALILTTVCVGCTNNRATTHLIKIVIPAGSQEDFVFSDEEISPMADTITIVAESTMGDTEVLLKPTQVKEENAYEPTYMTNGMPVTIEVEKDAWFKVGLNIQNNTDEDYTYILRINPVEVRIEDKSIELADKTYTYENGAFGGVENDEFSITLNGDGTFSYYEGMLSSYIGTKENCFWTLEGDTLILTDKTVKDKERINYFKVDGNSLIFQADKSANFIYVKVKDGEKFNETARD